MKWVYVMGVNLIAFYCMGSDKQRAKKREWRIAESTLFFLAAIGGAFGVWAGMYTFRHKTKKQPFVIGIPLLFLLTVMFLWTMR